MWLMSLITVCSKSGGVGHCSSTVEMGLFVALEVVVVLVVVVVVVLMMGNW